jgi:hypothetical protein
MHRSSCARLACCGCGRPWRGGRHMGRW